MNATQPDFCIQGDTVTSNRNLALFGLGLVVIVAVVLYLTTR